MWVYKGESHLGWLYHTWSLSVEEQFYLCWPSILLAAFALTRSVRGFTALTGLVLVACVFHRWLLIESGARADRIYLGLDTRCVDLLAGCFVVGLFQLRADSPRPSTRAGVAAADGALVLVLTALGAIIFWTPPSSDVWVQRYGTALVAALTAGLLLGLSGGPSAFR